MIHTIALGRRYELLSGLAEKVAPRLAIDKSILDRYLTAVQTSGSSARNVATGRRVIVISLLNCSDPRMTWGAIRNAQLLPVLLPGWKLRVYVEHNIFPSTRSPLQSPKAPEAHRGSSAGSPTSPDGPRVAATLQRLGAEVLPSGAVPLHRAPLNAILFETSNFDFVLFRPADWRLGVREAAAVKDWLRAAELGGPDAAVVHCVHDHVAHARDALVDELWGFRPEALRKSLRRRLPPASDQQEVDGGLTRTTLWPLVADAAYCHNSVTTCYNGPQAKTNVSFPDVGASEEVGFVGLLYDEHHQAVWDNTTSYAFPTACGSSA